MYWAGELAAQSEDSELKAKFSALASTLEASEAKIVEELNSAQGNKLDIGGYYHPNLEAVSKFMRPSNTLNSALESL